MEHIRVTTLWWLCALAAAATVGYYMGYAQANKLPSIVLKSPSTLTTILIVRFLLVSCSEDVLKWKQLLAHCSGPQTQKNGVPARVFVISMPKTACGSTATAIHKWFVDRGALARMFQTRNQTIERIYWAQGFVEHLCSDCSGCYLLGS